MKGALLTGALGQIGSELVVALRKLYGAERVVATDLRSEGPPEIVESGPFYSCDSRDGETLSKLISKYDVDTVFHLAAILSAKGEAMPEKTWQVNMGGLWSLLEVCRERRCALFFPSSIAAFGPQTPSIAPQDTIQRPESIYGISKVAGELLCDYYFQKFGVDTRGIRFPGIISHATPPGGGTSDYAVEIYYEAVDKGSYSCFVGPHTRMEMIYMPDVVDAVLHLMTADGKKLIHRNSFNIASMSFTPDEQAKSIARRLPSFKISYDVDPVRQRLADSWPDTSDDTAARKEWGWAPSYDLDATTDNMIEELSKKKTSGSI